MNWPWDEVTKARNWRPCAGWLLWVTNFESKCAKTTEGALHRHRRGRIPLGHLNFSASWDNCLNCSASARIISSFNYLISLICYYVHTVSLDFIKQYNPGHAQKLGPNGGCKKKMKKEPETSLKIFPLNQSRGLFWKNTLAKKMQSPALNHVLC